MSMDIHVKMVHMFKVTQEAVLMLIVATTETLKVMEATVAMNTVLMEQPINQILAMVVSTTTKMVLVTPMTANQSQAKVGSCALNPPSSGAGENMEIVMRKAILILLLTAVSNSAVAELGKAGGGDNATAQDLNPSNLIHLRCDGTARTSKAGNGGWPEQVERITIGVDIEQSSGIATISGLVLISHYGNTSPIVFEVKDNIFSWAEKDSKGSTEYLSVIKIDRYSATLEAEDMIVENEKGKSFIWSKSVKASCKSYANRAF